MLVLFKVNANSVIICLLKQPVVSFQLLMFKGNKTFRRLIRTWYQFSGEN